jgi:hypothetical protein
MSGYATYQELARHFPSRTKISSSVQRIFAAYTALD